MIMIYAFACQKEKYNSDCIDSRNIDLNKACIEIYQPVCGCDDKTYSNSCFAQINGLKNWTQGGCE